MDEHSRDTLGLFGRSNPVYLRHQETIRKGIDGFGSAVTMPVEVNYCREDRWTTEPNGCLNLDEVNSRETIGGRLSRSRRSLPPAVSYSQPISGLWTVRNIKIMAVVVVIVLLNVGRLWRLLQGVERMQPVVELS